MPFNISNQKSRSKTPADSLYRIKTRNEIKSGFLRGMPVVFGYFPIGFAFGILAANAGMSIGEVLLMSLLVYAGSAQLIAVGLLENQAGLLTLTITTFLVNLRHLLMSAALAPSLGHLRRFQQAFFAFELTDETFAVHSVDFENEKSPPPKRIFATNATAHLSWISSSVLGAWTGSILTGLEAWGIDYALPAMFISLLALQIKTSKHIAVAAISLLLSTLLFRGFGGHWHIIAATLIGASIGLALKENIHKGS